MAHAHTTQYTNALGNISRTHPFANGSINPQRQPSSDSPASIVTVPTSSSAPTFHPLSSDIVSPSVLQSIPASVSSPPVQANVPVSTTSTTNSSAGRQNFYHPRQTHQHQNTPRNSEDRMDRKDQRHRNFNSDRRELGEREALDGDSLTGSSSTAIHLKKHSVEREAILSQTYSSDVSGIHTSSPGARSRATSSDKDNSAGQVGTSSFISKNGNYIQVAEGSSSQISGESSSRWGPGPPSSRVVVPSPLPHTPHSQSQLALPTISQNSGAAPTTSGSHPSPITATKTRNKSRSTSRGAVTRKPPPSMPETNTADYFHLNSTSVVAANVKSPSAPEAKGIISHSSATLSATPTRRPSLASPLPPSPIIPTSFPRQRAPPAPLNLGPAVLPSTTVALAGSASPRAPMHVRSRTGSAGAYQHQHSPVLNQQHQVQRHNHSSTASLTHPHSPTAQYAFRPATAPGSGHTRPGSSSGAGVASGSGSGSKHSGHPDSPSASAMMRRLLSKPAPVRATHCSSGASGSESDTQRVRRVGGWTSGSESEGVALGRQRRYETDSAALPRVGSTLARAATATGSIGSAARGKKPKPAVAMSPSNRTGDSKMGAYHIPDFDFELLNADATPLGRQQNEREKSKVVSKGEKETHGKERENDKKPRNVLRRRPSAPAAISSTSSSPSSKFTTPPTPHKTPPLPTNIPPHVPSSGLPDIIPSSPFTLSPTSPEFRNRDAQSAFLSSSSKVIQPCHSISPHTPPISRHSSSGPSGKTLHRSTSAAAIPHSPRRSLLTHSRTVSQTQLGQGAMLSPRQSKFMSADLSGSPVPLSPSSNIAISVSPRRSAFVMHPDSDALGRNNASDGVCAPSGCAPVPMKMPMLSPRLSATPAASLAEAYKRQEAEKEATRRKEQQAREELKWGYERREWEERERELRAVERQRAMILGERERGRRFSEDGRGNAAARIARSKTVVPGTGLSPEEHNAARQSFFSINTNGSLDSVLPMRVRAARSGSTDALNAGSGFAVIERIAGTRSSHILTRPEIFELNPTSPRAFDNAWMGDWQRRSQAGDAENERQGSPEPYYTVFGGLGVGLGTGRGRVVLAGSTADVDIPWASVHPSQHVNHYDVSGVLQGKESGSRDGQHNGREKGQGKESLGRTLSRKVSGRWKKQPSGGGVVKEEKEGTEKDKQEGSRRRLLRKPSIAAISRQLPQQTNDEDMCAEQGVISPQVKTPLRNRDTPSTPSPGGSMYGLSSTVTSGAQETKGNAEKTENATGGRFWKMMRRLSVGGLKERFKEDAAVQAPPVPALPLNYRSQTFPSPSQHDSPSAPQTPTRLIPRVPVPQIPTGNGTSNTSSSSPMSSLVGFSTSTVGSTSQAPSIAPLLCASVSTASSSSSLLLPEAGSDTRASNRDTQVNEADGTMSPTIPSFATSDVVNNFKPARRSIGSSLKSTRSRESPHALPSKQKQNSRSQPVSPASASQASSSFTPPFMRPNPSASSSSSSLVASPSSTSAAGTAPPRPARSAQRPSPAAASAKPAPEIQVVDTTETQAQAQAHAQAQKRPAFYQKSPAGRKSESAIRDMASSHMRITPIYTQTQHEMRAHHRRSSDGVSTASTARPSRRSSAYGTSFALALPASAAASGSGPGSGPGSGLGSLPHRNGSTTAGSIMSVATTMTTTTTASVSPPPSAMTLSFGPVSPGAERLEKRPLTEAEKAARWEDLLERSAQAGGTLHIAGGARVLASDRLRFGRRKK